MKLLNPVLDYPGAVFKEKSLTFTGITSHSFAGQKQLDLTLLDSDPRDVAAFVPRIPVNRLRPALTRSKHVGHHKTFPASREPEPCRRRKCC